MFSLSIIVPKINVFLEGAENNEVLCSLCINEYFSTEYECSKIVYQTSCFSWLGSVHLSGLWGLVNNAGKLKVGMVEWQSMDSFKSIADVNLWGMILVTQTFLPLVKKARGRLINMGSILGKKYFSAFSGYQGVHRKWNSLGTLCQTVDRGLGGQQTSWALHQEPSCMGSWAGSRFV